MLKSLVMGAAVLLSAQAAQAQSFYALGSVGFSDFTDGEANNVCRNQRECDATGTAVKLIGGYQFTPALAAEVGYWNFGKITGRSGNFRQDLEASAFGGALAYHASFSRQWQGTARLGLVAMDARVSNNNGFSAQETSAQVVGGLALGYTLAPNLAIDSAWDFAFGSVNGSNFEVNALSLGLRLGF